MSRYKNMSDNKWKVISNNKPSNSSVFEEVLLWIKKKIGKI